MLLTYVYRPIRFYMITFLGTWISWFFAAYWSYQDGAAGLQLLFMILGLLAPCATALTMIYGSQNKEFKNDFWSRLCFRGISLKFIPVLLLLVPLALLLATLISLVFGQSADQFALSDQYKVMSGQSIASLLILFFAPLLEELGWRGYGVDSLRAYFNLFRTTMLFAALWTLWHLPLFFINGYYHHELWSMGIVYVINFFVSVLPATILMNWVYYKNSRNILVVILFHFIFNLFSVLFQTTQFTKCILTIVLLVISVVVVVKNKKFFTANSTELR
jgi:membrane protease YdiL (CAAX protease family)